MKTVGMPREIIVDPKEKLFYATPEVTAAMPDVNDKFAAIDRVFDRQLTGTLSEMYSSVDSLITKNGAEIEYSVLPGTSNEALVIWAPFSDTAPTSMPAVALSYLRGLDYGERSDTSSNKADTNSWNQITKSTVMSALLKESGIDMPVITIFSPVPDKAFLEKDELKKGSFFPSMKILSDVVAESQDLLHGPSSETQIDTLHLHGASLGASHVISVGEFFNTIGSQPRIASITAQELIAGVSGKIDFAKRYVADGSGGDVSNVTAPPLEQAVY